MKSKLFEVFICSSSDFIQFWTFNIVFYHQYFHFACIISLGSANDITLRIFVGHYSFVLCPFSYVLYMISNFFFSSPEENSSTNRRKKIMNSIPFSLLIDSISFQFLNEEKSKKKRRVLQLIRGPNNLRK